jgi:LysR family transcriptional regulator for metE and metH
VNHIPSPQLDVRDLRLVVALSSAGSTTRAAAVLHLSQPAVSRALLLTEEKVGAKLFARTARGLLATAAGERLIDGARPLLAELVDLEHRVGSTPSAPSRVRMVCECYTAYRWLPSVLAGLGLPGLEVVLCVEHTHGPVPALLDGKIDVALLTNSPVRRGLLEAPLFADEVVFLVGKGHPLAAKKAVGARDLRETTLLLSNATPPAEARWFFSRVFGGKRPRLSFVRFPLTEAIIDAARAGMGVAILSEWIAAPYLDDGSLVMKRLVGGPLKRSWRIAYRREAADAAERLRRALAATAPRVPPG